ncbi:RING/FYVE/PHD zinc finger superfamily protein [Zea mays]|uniref:RING/FYVE/PHD zinc finger superfamily protein n=1 Tax=Zea mays TaxID=4577 RepID=A0A1D6GZM1_MAIZE|nr:RING/FYVE/PHD zinc finger superfamily protein [Zea mays]
MQGGTEKEQGTRVQDEQQDNPTNPFHSQSSRLQVSGLESLPSRTRHLTPPPPRRPHPSIPYHTIPPAARLLSRHLRPALRSPPRLCLIPPPPLEGDTSRVGARGPGFFIKCLTKCLLGDVWL